MRWVDNGAAAVATLRATHVSGPTLWDGNPPPRKKSPK
jgi:hypothetical protein